MVLPPSYIILMREGRTGGRTREKIKDKTSRRAPLATTLTLFFIVESIKKLRYRTTKPVREKEHTQDSSADINSYMMWRSL